MAARSASGIAAPRAAAGRCSGCRWPDVPRRDERYNCALRNRGRALSLAAVLAAYAVLAFGVLSTDVVSSGDIGVKFVQAHALLDSGFRSLAMPNRGSVIDPQDQFS